MNIELRKPFIADYIIDETISIKSTPGHTLSCVSVIVNSALIPDLNATNPAVVVVAGDLFEKKEDLYNENLWLDAGSENPYLQRKHRMQVSNIADFIIPGHGGAFAVDKECRNQLKSNFDMYNKETSL